MVLLHLLAGILSVVPLCSDPFIVYTSFGEYPALVGLYSFGVWLAYSLSLYNVL